MKLFRKSNEPNKTNNAVKILKWIALFILAVDAFLSDNPFPNFDVEENTEKNQAEKSK